jgi:hypothetical protein
VPSGRAKIPRLFLEHPLKGRLTLFFSTHSTKRLSIIMATIENYLISDFYFQLLNFNFAANLFRVFFTLKGWPQRFFSLR